MYWANFLHIYQPPTQDEEVLQRIVHECYRPLFNLLLKSPRAKMTLNINACLSEMLINHGYGDVIGAIGQLAQEGKAELTGSAMYHPILPLLPPDEVERQIELNSRSNERIFKGVYRPRGFFPPEMCYSQSLAALVKKMGFDWVIIDEISYSGNLGFCPNDRTYSVPSASCLKVYFKERKISTAIAFGQCRDIHQFRSLAQGPGTSTESFLLTATDGETYGHHVPGLISLLEQVYQDVLITPCTLTELSGFFPHQENVEPIPGSWSTWEDEICRGIPYPQWSDPGNEIHQLLWQLIGLLYEKVNAAQLEHEHEQGWQSARAKLDQCWHSCQWWWASCRPWWGPDMVKRGGDLIIGAFLDLQEIGIDGLFQVEAKHLAKKLARTLREMETSGRAHNLQREYLKSHPLISSMLKFG